MLEERPGNCECEIKFITVYNQATTGAGWGLYLQCGTEIECICVGNKKQRESKYVLILAVIKGDPLQLSSVFRSWHLLLLSPEFICSSFLTEIHFQNKDVLGEEAEVWEAVVRVC